MLIMLLNQILTPVCWLIMIFLITSQMMMVVMTKITSREIVMKRERVTKVLMNLQKDEHFRKALRKFMTKWSKLRNSNQDTIIGQFHDFSVERKRKHSYLIPVQSTAISGGVQCLRQVDITRR